MGDSNDSRHPWTYADDFVRMLGPIGEDGLVLSRADASVMIEGIAKALGLATEELAIKLSEAEQSKTEVDHSEYAARFMRAMGVVR